MKRLASASAEVKPGRSAASLSGMPGPWSLTRMVLPPSRMVMTTPAKEACTRLSMSSRNTLIGMRPPCSRARE